MPHCGSNLGPDEYSADLLLLMRFGPHIQFSLLVKEVHLPFSEQTHEVVFEPRTRCLFVTQMSNSVLVRVPVGAPPSFEHVGRTLEEKRGQP